MTGFRATEASQLVNVSRKVRIGIIGAGPSGLITAQTLKDTLLGAPEDALDHVEVELFERQCSVGGQWNLTPSTRTGNLVSSASHGSQHSSMYENLWTNTPKECQELPHYPYKTHFESEAMPSYLTRTEMKNYMLKSVEGSDLMKHVKFDTEVESVKVEKSGLFSVSYSCAGNRYTSLFDKLVVAAGHYWKPNVPFFPGLSSFKGRVLHSHDFRSGGDFKDQHVLCIGSHYSGEDIGLTCLKFGASKVTVSHHKTSSGNVWPKGVTEKCNLKCVKEDWRTLHFDDGSTAADIDSIILCTGYIHYYPFMPHDLRLDSPNTLYPPHLYHGVVWTGNPNLFYVGAQDQIFSFPMIVAQAKLVRQLVLPFEVTGHEVALPSQENMEADVSKWIAKLGSIGSLNEAIDFQADHVTHLSKLAEDEESHKRTAKITLGQAQVFKDFMKDKAKNLWSMRELQYTSAVSGVEGVACTGVSWAQDLEREEYDTA